MPDSQSIAARDFSPLNLSPELQVSAHTAGKAPEKGLEPAMAGITPA